MVLDSTVVREYFASSARWLWDWDEDGEVIIWSDGTTLTFRIELVELLDRLVLTGLPRFGSIMLLLAATRSGWTVSKGRTTLIELVGNSPYAKTWFGLALKSIDLLDRLHEMRDLLTGAVQKAQLAKIVFERASHRQSPEQSAALVRALRRGFAGQSVTSRIDISHREIVRDLRDLHDGLVNLTRESFELQTVTGLDRPVVALQQDLPVGVTARQLVRQLLDDQDLGGIARLAMRISAAIQLPRPHRENEQLPVGGVNDIANHGTLDRLLLSELVYDDLTLAVRVAMNEALYMRREPQARQPTRQTFVLLDSGLRMWGVPRVYATAVALAVAARADQHMSVSVWRAQGNELVPVDFSTAHGVNQHLAALSHQLHPGRAIESFARQVRTADAPTT